MADSVNTVNSGGGADYTTIQAAIDDSDFTGIDRWVIEIQNNARYSENLTVGGSLGTPTSTSHIFITAVDASYHAGVAGAGTRIQPTAADHAAEITEAFVHLHKLNIQISSASSSSNECIRITGDLDGLIFERCILDGQERNRTTSDGDGIYHNNDNPTINLYNTLIIDCGRLNCHHNRFGGTLNAEFLTSYRSSVDESTAGQQGNIFAPRTSGSPTLNVYNTVAADTVPAGVDEFQSAGSPTTNASHNAAQDTSAPGTSTVSNLVPADAWTDPTNFDLTILDTDSALYQAGTDRSGSKPDSRVDATIDIVGTTRPATPSIGAFELAAGGAVEFVATATAVSGQTSDLDVSRPLQSTAAAVSTASADLAVSRDMVATAVGVSGQQSDLDAGRNFDATAAATSGHQADLATTRNLQSTAAAVSGSSADVVVARDMSGTAAGVSGHQADLAVAGQVTFDGTAVAVSGSQADAVVARDIAGQADAVSGSSADLDRQPGFVGTAAGVSGASADMAVARDMTGTAVATSDTSADAIVARDMIGTAAGVSGHTADLAVSRPLSATAAATSGSTAEAAVARDMDGTAAGVSGHTADLTIAGQLTLDGTAAGLSGHQADLAVSRPLSGTATAASGSTADAAIARDMVGTAEAVSGHTAAAAIQRDLSGTATSVSTADADVAVARDMEGTATAVSDTSSELSIQGQAVFNGTATATSGASGSLAVSRPLSGTATATSGTQATLARVVDLIATAPSISGSSANLDRQPGFTGSAAGVSGHTADLDVLSTSTFYVATNGDDADDGSLGTPWATVEFAISQLSAGDTLLIRGGTYDESDIGVTVSGTAPLPIKIQAFPSETVVIDGSFTEFRTSGNSNWELVDAGRHEYRSVNASIAAVGELLSGEFTNDGERFTLAAYLDSEQGLADLQSNEFNVAAGARYAGPGLYNNGGRIHVRLEMPDQTALLGQLGNYITQEAPDVGMRISDKLRIFNITGSFIEVSGDIELVGAKYGVEIKSGSSDVTFYGGIKNNCTAVCWLVRDGAANLTVDGCQQDVQHPPWIAWTDMKGGGAWSAPVSNFTTRVSFINADNFLNLTVTNNIAARVFDFCVANGDTTLFSGNVALVIDDFLQLGSNSENVEITGNTITGAGPSHNGNGNSAGQGTTYIHRNTIDARYQMLWGKNDPLGLLLPQYIGFAGTRPFQSHGSANIGTNGDPWKIYHNTVYFDGLRQGNAGAELWINVNTSGSDHAVYNNIFVETGGGAFYESVDTTVANQEYDGNIYYHSGASGLIHDDEATEGDVATLASWQATTTAINEGLDQNSKDGDPELSALHTPSLTGSAASGAVAIPGGYPGGGETYIGAVAPSLITPVQVINLLGSVDTFSLEGSIDDPVDLEGST